MLSLYDLIKKIEKRPSLYLGKPSLSQLQTFLDGYTFALRQLDIPVSEQEREFETFQQWIEQKFHLPSTQHWTKIILFYAEDEQDAIEQFFQLFHEFLIEDNSSSKEIKLDKITSSSL